MIRNCAKLLRPSAQARTVVPARSWNQCTSFLSLPPRNPVSLMETIGHCTFMMVVWLLPTFVGLSQVKIWKRTYLQGTG